MFVASSRVKYKHWIFLASTDIFFIVAHYQFKNNINISSLFLWCSSREQYSLSCSKFQFIWSTWKWLKRQNMFPCLNCTSATITWPLTKLLLQNNHCGKYTDILNGAMSPCETLQRVSPNLLLIETVLTRSVGYLDGLAQEFIQGSATVL